MKKQLINCPTCQGSGKITTTASILTDKGWREEDPIELKCYVCDGEGKVDADEQAARDKAQEEFWCSCGNPSGDVQFFDDGESERCDKHHYVCKDCNKVVQVG